MLIYRYDPGVPNENNLPLLVSSALVGSAIFMNRVFGAIAQPLVGHFSDRLSSRWGRRRPFVAVGIMPLVFCFILLFTPPLNSVPIGNFVYLIGILCLFYLALAIYFVPYLAWIPDLARTPKERVNLSTLIAVFSLLGTAIGGICSPWLTSQFGFSKMASIIGGIGFVTLLMPLAVTEELVPVEKKYLTFWKSLRLAWHNPSFRSYSSGITCAWVTVSILTICPTFLAVALLNRDISFGAVINAVVLGSSAMGLPLVNLLAKYWGKRRIFQLSMIWFGCGLLAIGICPILFEDALLPWLVLLFLSGLGLAGFFILPNAMLPDLIDEDAKQTGLRREAIYFGTRGLLAESSIGLGAMLAGLILMLGKTPEQPWGVQLAFPVAGLFALASAWFFSFYPIKK
ncbi:MAG: MFS transporter [Prochloraceae cyanobacterium]|nr:MFS transporter [Prochloraceae cyanobacterium]